jgi:hypothetical protein
MLCSRREVNNRALIIQLPPERSELIGILAAGIVLLPRWLMKVLVAPLPNLPEELPEIDKALLEWRMLLLSFR